MEIKRFETVDELCQAYADSWDGTKPGYIGEYTAEMAMYRNVSAMPRFVAEARGLESDPGDDTIGARWRTVYVILQEDQYSIWGYSAERRN